MYKFLLAALFFLLSPGVLITLPAGSKGVWMSGQTSVAAALVHSLVFVIVLTVIMKHLWKKEGFYGSASGAACSKNGDCTSNNCVATTKNGTTTKKCG
jgi:hypothetical protein